MPVGAFFRIENQNYAIMNIFKYLKETQAELREVTFPTMSMTITYTVIVVVLSVIIALVLGGVDFGIREGLIKILSRS